MAENPYFPDEISESVQFLGATGGPKHGEISSLPARIWLAHNECFVDAYMLKLESGAGKTNDHHACNIGATLMRCRSFRGRLRSMGRPLYDS
jgi:hypothetical protein